MSVQSRFGSRRHVVERRLPTQFPPPLLPVVGYESRLSLPSSSTPPLSPSPFVRAYSLPSLLTLSFPQSPFQPSSVYRQRGIPPFPNLLFVGGDPILPFPFRVEESTNPEANSSSTTDRKCPSVRMLAEASPPPPLPPVQFPTPAPPGKPPQLHRTMSDGCGRRPATPEGCRLRRRKPYLPPTTLLRRRLRC